MEEHASLTCAAAYAQLAFLTEGAAAEGRLERLAATKSPPWRDPAEDVLDPEDDSLPSWAKARFFPLLPPCLAGCCS